MVNFSGCLTSKHPPWTCLWFNILYSCGQLLECQPKVCSVHVYMGGQYTSQHV